MVLAINGMYLKHNAAGIGNVIINAANEFAKNDDIKVVFYTNKEFTEENKNRLSNNINIIVEPLSFASDNSTLWFLIKFPFLINRDKPDLLWSPAVWTPLFLRKKQKVLVTVHDFVSKDFKNTMRKINKVVSSFIENRSIKSADYIWTVSEYTKDKLLNYYPTIKKDIFVGSAPNPKLKTLNSFCEEERKLFDSLKVNNYFLFVGTLEPRKNLKFMIELFDYLRYSERKLVIVGARGWGKTEIAEIINSNQYLKENVVFTGFVSEEELQILYNRAELFISTSLNEGFGLPQAEAMNCSCPVICPHNSAMIEVVDGAGITVKDWNYESWKDAIEYTLKNRTEIIKRQNVRVEKYKWTTVIKELLNFLGRNNENFSC